MPRKKKDTAGDDSPKKAVEQGLFWLANEAKWGGFINVRLDDDQTEAFHAWDEENPTEGARVLEDVLGEGMKVGLAYDRENQCTIVSFTGALCAGSNERYCCTSRAGTIREAIQLAAWKHSELARGDYGNYSPRISTMMSWG